MSDLRYDKSAGASRYMRGVRDGLGAEGNTLGEAGLYYGDMSLCVDVVSVLRLLLVMDSGSDLAPAFFPRQQYPFGIPVLTVAAVVARQGIGQSAFFSF